LASRASSCPDESAAGRPVEAALLALVAIFTAWSGYRSVKRDASRERSTGSRRGLRFEAGVASPRAGQEQLYDA
jgi:hypothetical protein